MSRTARSPKDVDPARALRALGARPRRSLSQSFLTDERIADAIVEAAELDPSRDDVLEIGPGLGILTERLVHRARRIVAVEIDERLARDLGDRLNAPNLEVRVEDALKLQPSDAFSGPFTVVANLPYHITSPLIRHLLRAGPPFATALVVMVQREVAERIAARAGSLSALAVSVQVLARVRICLRVPPTAFVPRPAVASAVVRLDPLAERERLVGRADLDAFDGLVRAGFAQPRKLLVSSLAQGLTWDRPRVAQLLQQVGVSPEVRPQELDLSSWVALWKAWSAA